MKILLIDDDEALSTIFSAALKREGFETSQAFNGANGIEKARTENPNLILLDQILPDTKGNDVLKELKSDDRTKNIPVIFLSNFSQEELVKEAIEEGAQEYILKYQVEPKDVVAKVKQALNI